MRAHVEDVRQHLATHSPWLHLVMNPIIWEFLAGVAIGHLYLCRWFRVRSVQTAWLMAVCGIGFAAWFVFGRIVTFHGPAQWGWARLKVAAAPPAAAS